MAPVSRCLISNVYWNTFSVFRSYSDSQEHSDLMWQYVENSLSQTIIKYQVSSENAGSREEFEELLCKLVSSVDKTM